MARPSVLSRVALLTLAGISLGLASSAAPQAPPPAVVGAAVLQLSPPADPIPLRRTYLTGEPLAAALAQVARGDMVRLPRDEFEAKVKAAALAPAPPRVAEARYRATLTESGLVGTAEWRIAAARPGLIPLDPLRAALCAARWPDGREAQIVRTGQPATAHLIVPQGGDTTLSLNWSLRGAEEPAGEQFDLAFPSAPVAALELDLPADRVPAVRAANQLLTGPLPAPAADRRVWRVAFGGESRVELTVRRPRRDGEPSPAVRASRFTRFELVPGIATCTYEFDFEAVRGLPTEWVFEADAGLRVTGVTGPGRLSWRAEAADGRPTRVVVTSQEPPTVARVTVTGFAPVLPTAPVWTGPLVRFVDAFPGSDALEVRIDSELKFTNCEPGDYRVVASGPADRGYRVALTATLVPAGDDRPARRPPTFHIRPAESELSVTEDVTWRVGLGGSDLTARFRGRTLRGPVSRLFVEISPGLTPERVRSVPEDAELTWSSQPGGVLIDPPRPLTTGQAFEFVLDFRGPATPLAPDPAAPPGARVSHPFPRVSLAAAERDGALAVVADPALAVWASPDPPAPNLTYPYRGRSPDGTLTVAVRQPRVTVSGDTTLSLDGGELVSTTTYTVGIAGGAVGSLTLAAPEAAGVRWRVQADGATVQRTASGELIRWRAALVSPWAAAMLPRVGTWRIEYPTPRSGVTAFSVEGRRPVPRDGATVPLPILLGVSPTAGSVDEGAGLFPSVRWRANDKIPVAAPPSAEEWAFADVELLVGLAADGRVENIYSGTVTAAGGPTLPVGLPDGAVVSAALVAGKHVDHLAPAPPHAANGRWVELPLPDASGVRFELRYTLPATTTGSAARVVSPTPQLPGEPSTRVMWTVSPEFRRWPRLDSPSEPTEAESVTVVAAGTVTAVGYALAALAIGIAVVLWFGRRGTRSRVAFAVAAAALGVVAWTAPAGWLAVVRPPLVVSLLGVAAAVTLGGRQAAQPRPGRPQHLTTTISATPLVALSFVTLSAASAQAPEPVVVYVVAGPNRLDILAPPSVLDRLDAIARTPLPATSILSAEYEGTAAGNSATMTATFRVLCTREGDQVLNLPLTGVRLESLDLDGKPAFPDSSRADRYAVTVRGAGTHVLTAKFVVPSAAAGAEREVRIGVPDVPCSKVRFTAPAAADVPTRRGSQLITRAGGRVKAEADHGGGRSVAIRWRDGTEAGAKPTVTVSEACVWEVGEAGASATVAFLFRVAGGATDRFVVEIPEGLESARPVVRAADGRGSGLREWRVNPGPAGWRTVTVQLQAPVEGSVTVTLRLFPTRPAGASPTLRFPRAVGVSQSDSYYALRLDRVTAVDLPRSGVVDLTADALARDFPAADELGAGPFDSVFRRAGSDPPEVRPVLRPTDEPSTGAAETLWTVGPHAEAHGVVQSTRPGQTGFEFELPVAVRLDSLRCPDLHTWGRVGSRVQVWLKKPTREVTVRWTGTVAAGTAELPFARLVGAGPATVRVRPADGWVVVPLQTRGLKPSPSAPDVGDLGYEAEAAAPAPRFEILPPVAPSSVEVAETVERAADGLRYRAAVRVPLAPGRPHHLGFHLVGLPADANAEVSGPDGVRIGPGPPWEVGTPPLQQPLTLTVTIRLTPGSPLPVPEVAFGGPPVPAVRTLTLGAGLTAVEEAGQRTVSESPPSPAAGTSPAQVSTPDDPPSVGDTGLSPAWGNLAAAAAWAAALAVVLVSARFGRPRWWSERVAACGLLAAVVVGMTTLAGVVFLALAAVGTLGRLAWALDRLGRVALR